MKWIYRSTRVSIFGICILYISQLSLITDTDMVQILAQYAALAIQYIGRALNTSTSNAFLIQGRMSYMSYFPVKAHTGWSPVLLCY